MSQCIPVIYSVTQGSGNDLGEASKLGEASAAPPAGEEVIKREMSHRGGINQGAEEVYEVRMQDLASGMTRPCAMLFVMGTRTCVPSDFAADAMQPRPELLAACKELDASCATPEEEAAGGVTQLRHLKVLDAVSSTATLGFRIDAAKTVIDGESLTLGNLPLPDGMNLATLRDEKDVAKAIGIFVQSDPLITKQAAIKIDAIKAACERSMAKKEAGFMPRHALLRSSLLLVYDDAQREHVELKVSPRTPPATPSPTLTLSYALYQLGSTLHVADAACLDSPLATPQMINFGFSYRIPEEAPDLTHKATWSGKPEDNEDGYLVGVDNLTGVFRRLTDELSEVKTQLFRL